MAEKNRTALEPLAFEQPIRELEERIRELQQAAEKTGMSLLGEIEPLRARLRNLLKSTYEGLSAWERVQVARHGDRPGATHYIQHMLDEFIELFGDRLYGDDRAIVTGFARMGGQAFLLVGHRKGRSVQERLECHFGCAHPEGYRKALLKMKLAEKLGIPIVSLINTPGAFPGIEAEERGQARAIATNILELSRLRVPIIAVIIGEGGSGGALGIGLGDKVAILEHAYYSVISPEGCAAILWKDAARAPDAAQALRLTSGDLLRLGVVDEVIPEPLGGAHRDPARAIVLVRERLMAYLRELQAVPIEELLERRYEKWRRMGQGVSVA